MKTTKSNTASRRTKANSNGTAKKSGTAKNTRAAKTKRAAKNVEGSAAENVEQVVKPMVQAIETVSEKLHEAGDAMSQVPQQIKAAKTKKAATAKKTKAAKAEKTAKARTAKPKADRNGKNAKPARKAAQPVTEQKKSGRDYTKYQIGEDTLSKVKLVETMVAMIARKHPELTISEINDRLSRQELGLRKPLVVPNRAIKTDDEKRRYSRNNIKFGSQYGKVSTQITSDTINNFKRTDLGKEAWNELKPKAVTA
jgi:hypothetical protein